LQKNVHIQQRDTDQLPAATLPLVHHDFSYICFKLATHAKR